HGVRYLSLHPAPGGGAGGRRRLHAVRDPLRVPRLSHPRGGNGRRVRRSHLSRGARATHLPGARRPSTRGDPAVRLVVMAYQDIGWVALDELLSLGAEIAAVVTHRDDPGENVWFRSVAERARQAGLPVRMPASVNDPEVIATIARLAPDVIFSFYFRELLSAEVLALARQAALNLHGSLLPRYRGRCPVNWVLVHGERETGVTLHHMEARPDRGDIVAQRAVPIADDDTALSLNRKLGEAARLLLRETYPLLLAGRAPRIPQDHARASYFGGRRPEDGRLQWRQSARQLYNLVRAVTHPYPGAFTTFRG